eukprot:scaffold15889_cov184-Skeletonema_marinoi.AAC.2
MNFACAAKELCRLQQSQQPQPAPIAAPAAKNLDSTWIEDAQDAMGGPTALQMQTPSVIS